MNNGDTLRRKLLTGADVFENSSEFTCSINHDRQTLQQAYRLFGCKDGILRSWPEKTDVHCWHCRHAFDGAPCSVPYAWCVIYQCWEMKGCFCSLNCAKRYILDNSTLSRTSQQLVALSLFAKEVMGYHENIVAAHPFEMLTSYGGSLSIEEFRRLNHHPDKIWIEKIEQPFLSFPMMFNSIRENSSLNSSAAVLPLRPDKSPRDMVAHVSATDFGQQGLYTEFLKKKKAGRRTKNKESDEGKEEEVEEGVVAEAAPPSKKRKLKEPASASGSEGGRPRRKRGVRKKSTTQNTGNLTKLLYSRRRRTKKGC